MDSLKILDLVGGMIFVYFLMSIVANSIFELFSTFTEIKAKMLQKWIVKTFPSIAKNFLDNPLIDGVSPRDKASAYISGRNFSLVLMQSIAVASRAGKMPETLSEFAEMLKKAKQENPDILPSGIADALQLMIVEAQAASQKAEQIKTEFELLHESVEKWYDSIMERLSSGYKRKASYFIFGIALVVTFFLNVDSLRLMRFLYTHDAQRTELATAAFNAPNNPVYQMHAGVVETTDTTISRDSTMKSVVTVITHKNRLVTETSDSLRKYIPIGWDLSTEYGQFKRDYPKVGCPQIGFSILKLLGLLITVFAVSLGSPFWFDLLSKAASLRTSLKPASSLTKEVIKKSQS